MTRSLMFAVALWAAAATVQTVHAFPGQASGPAPAVDMQISLAELMHPDRFAWPARFVCRTDINSEPITVVGVSVADLNSKLLAMDLYAEDCRAGFSVRSLRAERGKLDEIVGRVTQTLLHQ